ncbi:Substrate-specific component NikM of nickel ECF transporter [Thioalkalivibrio nitratireducens DSM 14787]|uniref:Substrate-specific component NikM of nickel ECF transporter n=1 Tax=Thioalkalivibrio nitratireducens (strain DSM 14787 / UNIQEM 213 / ALEN2) TaxID=1255043 RepID=L0DVF8_THIND|nr:ECF transporter S component [Thioalkalivibrio nitratireducens]AGA32992.1 Substrate-specific component NikM of nickel ECF transporter [Thioalkalivibrio nitratireducens DSM 14787]
MHIPDGLISPQTYLPALVLAVPLWWWAGRRFTAAVGDEALPRLAVFTALAFLLSSLMLPLPGGTSGHAIGVALLALVFGPWVAFLAYTLVLVLQALVTGAGGITALPVNALVLGFVGAWAAWLLFHSLRRVQPAFAVLAAVFVSVLLSALLVALVLGLQPWIARAPDGSPRFFPFDWSVTLPAIVLPHVFIGLGEAVLTLLVWRHACRRRWASVACEREA